MSQTSKPYSSSQYIKTLSAIHLGFLLAISSFAMLGIALATTWGVRFDYAEDPFVFVVPILAITGIALSNFMFKKQLESIEKSSTLKQKLGAYLTASVIKYALIEAPALLGIVVFNISENVLFLIIGVAVLFYLLMQRPTKEKLINDLNLNAEMRARFQNEHALID